MTLILCRAPPSTPARLRTDARERANDTDTLGGINTPPARVLAWRALRRALTVARENATNSTAREDATRAEDAGTTNDRADVRARWRRGRGRGRA